MFTCLAAPIGEQRIFKEEFVVGAPNLIVTSSGILKTSRATLNGIPNFSI